MYTSDLLRYQRNYHTLIFQLPEGPVLFFIVSFQLFLSFPFCLEQEAGYLKGPFQTPNSAFDMPRFAHSLC